MRLYISLKYFVIHWISKTLYLVLERSTNRIYSSLNFSFEAEGISAEDIFYIDIFCLLGIIPVSSSTLIVVATSADLKGSLQGRQVYEIREIELIELALPEDHKSVETEKASIKKLFSSGFYFSFTYPLTRPTSALKDFRSLHEDSDKRFYWNLGLYKEFVAQDVDPVWFVPLIQGFFAVFNSSHVSLALISRRSCERAGTRYNCRGIDGLGQVANFVETEQVMVVENEVFSYLQVRGSVPVYWEQTGITAHLSLTKSHELSSEAFQKHVDDLLRRYGHLTMINLLAHSKACEQALTSEWKKAFDRLYPAYKDRLAYIYFDFHANCKGQKFHKVNLLVEKLSLFSEYYGYYSSSGKSQRGVMRTNCLDCLDRTNVVQGKLAWDVLLKQLRTVNKDFELTQQPLFAQAFKHQWADNGDKLSFQYTGTGSTISAITRTDTQGFAALIKQGLTSIERFYNANVEDSVKQSSIEHVLRKHTKSVIVDKVHAEPEKRRGNYSETFDLKLRIVAWNLEDQPLSHFNFNELSGCPEQCAVVVFTFQQGRDTQELEAGLVPSVAGFSLLKSIVLGTLSCLVFVDSAIIGEVSKLAFESFALPCKLKAGQKQAFATSFSLYDSSFCFISCSLAGGAENSSLRREQLSFTQSQPFTSRSFDYKFLCGDLSFSVDLGPYHILQSVTNQKLPELVKYEQLTQSIKYGYLAELKEPQISFPPNFPFVEGTDDYDLTQKRGPCWRERILVQGRVQTLAYASLRVRTGTHRPVEGIFSLQVCRVDLKAKKDTERGIYDRLEPGPLGELPKRLHCVKDLLDCKL